MEEEEEERERERKRKQQGGRKVWWSKGSSLSALSDYGGRRGPNTVRWAVVALMEERAAGMRTMQTHTNTAV